MMVQKKLFITLLGASLLSASAYAAFEHGYDIAMKDGKPILVERTTKDKAYNVAKRGFYATCVGIAARMVAKHLAPKEWKGRMSLLMGSGANAALNYDILNMIVKNPKQALKNKEVIATLGAVAGGEVLGHYGPENLSKIKSKLPSYK